MHSQVPHFPNSICTDCARCIKILWAIFSSALQPDEASISISRLKIWFNLLNTQRKLLHTITSACFVNSVFRIKVLRILLYTGAVLSKSQSLSCTKTIAQSSCKHSEEKTKSKKPIKGSLSSPVSFHRCKEVKNTNAANKLLSKGRIYISSTPVGITQ